MGLFTSRLGSVLLRPEIIEDPKKSEIRGNLCEILAHEGQPEAIRIFFEMADRVKYCPFEDAEDITPDKAMVLREDEQKRILRAVQIVEANIMESQILDEDELDKAEHDILKLKEEINNN